MTIIKALPDGGEQGLELLGELHAIKGAPAGEIRVQKRVTIPGAGAYWKEFRAPLYSRQVMEELIRRGEESCKLCLGVLATKGGQPKGYVRRKLGLFELCLPVFPKEGFSFLTWKTLGFLPAGEGYLTVVKRRIAYWVWLGIATVLAFVLAYWSFRYGLGTVLNWFAELPQTISDTWFRTLHAWGVI